MYYYSGQTLSKDVGVVVKSGFSRNPYSRVFFNDAIEEVDHH